LETPVALTIAGSDNSSGAGIQADLKTFSHFGVYGQTAITCVVAEVPGKVSSIQEIDLAIVHDQIALSVAHFPIRAVKTGMLYSAEIVKMVADTLESIPRSERPPLVVDPVMVASSGDLLLQQNAIAIYEARLFPLAVVVTPNLPEASVLLGKQIKIKEDAHAAASELHEKFGVPFLLKGGHLGLPEAVDFLVDKRGIQSFSAEFKTGIITHGTGCTFSAAITANLALGFDLVQAIAIAKKYVTRAIHDSLRWSTRSGTQTALRHFC